MITDSILHKRQVAELNERIQLWQEHEILPKPILLIGPPGIGKTYVGKLYAEHFRDSKVFACSAIDKREWSNYWRRYRHGYMPILDELESAEKRYQRSLMDSCNSSLYGITVTFVATTNSLKGLVSPLVDRCQTITFSRPSATELEAMAFHIAKRLELELSAIEATRAAMACNASLRELERIPESLKRKTVTGTGNSVSDVLEANGLTPEGYTEKQIAYLKWLRSIEKGNVSESMACFHLETDSSGLATIESRLRADGLITIVNGIGRTLESAGDRYLESLENLPTIQ